MAIAIAETRTVDESCGQSSRLFRLSSRRRNRLRATLLLLPASIACSPLTAIHFEYTQVCLELRGVCEIILITLQYSVDEDSVAGSANASAIVPLSHVSAASRMRPTETNFFSTASQTWRPNRGLIVSLSPRRRGRHAEDHLKWKMASQCIIQARYHQAINGI